VIVKVYVTSNKYSYISTVRSLAINSLSLLQSSLHTFVLPPS